MSDRSERILHWAAAVSAVILGLLATFPQSWHERETIGAPWSYLVGAILALTLVGFHLRMILECIRGPWTRTRILWLVFLFALPIAPALVYFLFSRSRTFRTSISVAES